MIIFHCRGVQILIVRDSHYIYYESSKGQFDFYVNLLGVKVIFRALQ